jgi:hypothetical protein
MKCVCSAALAAALLAVPALAATPPANPPAAQPTTAAPQDTAPAAPASQTAAPADAAQTGAPAAGAAAAPTAASATVGMSVRDNTGATIGQITALDPGSTGKTMATVKMGSQTFAVDASALAVQNGAATINETRADIEKQLPKTQ